MKINLANSFSSFVNFIKSKFFLKGLLSTLLFVLIFFFSGFAFSRVATYRTAFNVILGIFTIVLIIYFILTIKIPSEIRKPKQVILFYLKRIKFDIPFLYIVFIGVACIISMAVSNDFGSTGITNFASIFLTFLAAYGFTKIVSFQSVVKTFKKIFPWFCLISLVFFGIINEFNINHSLLFFLNVFD